MILNLNQITKLVFFIIIGSFVACRDGNDENSNNSFGDEGSLHPDTESLALYDLMNNHLGSFVSEVQGQPIVSVEEEEESAQPLNGASSVSDDFYSNFVFYPSNIITSRGYKSISLVDKVGCLKLCLADTNCGSVVYFRAISICKLHGPNQSKDKLIPKDIKTTEGALLPDTYVIPARVAKSTGNVDYMVTNNYGFSDGNKPAYLKLLFTDKTASDWLELPADVDQLSVSAEYRMLEAVVIAMKEHSSRSGYMNPIQISPEDYDGSNLFFNVNGVYTLAPFVDAEFFKALKINGSCDSDTEDGCTNAIVLPADSNSNKNYTTFEDVARYKKLFLY